MKILFTEDSKKEERFGIGLEINNGLFAATSISYNIIVMILLKKIKIDEISQNLRNKLLN